MRTQSGPGTRGTSARRRGRTASGAACETGICALPPLLPWCHVKTEPCCRSTSPPAPPPSPTRDQQHASCQTGSDTRLAAPSRGAPGTPQAARDFGRNRQAGTRGRRRAPRAVCLGHGRTAAQRTLRRAGCRHVRLSRAIGASSKGGHEQIQKKYASLDRPPVKIHLTQPLLPWLQPRSSRVEHVRGVRSSACDMWRAAIWAMHLHCVWLDSLASGFVPMRSVALGGHPVGRSLSVAVIRGSGPKDSGVICVSVSLALCAMSMMTTALSN